jgi:hypothetical protein
VNTYSTSVGSVDTFRYGISSIAVAGGRSLVSTTSVVVSDINSLYLITNQSYNIIKGSSFQTPYFWASTVVDLHSISTSTISTADPGLSSLGLTYYPTFSSIYNYWNDTRTFGKPSLETIPRYATNMDLNYAGEINRFSTPSGVIYSTMVAVNGTFSFYPSEDTLTWSVEYSGALYLKVFTTTYSQPPIYLKPSDFTTNTITASIGGFNSYNVEFTFLKLLATDYIRISNFRDIGTSNFELSPMYMVYGYSPSDIPLYRTSIPFNSVVGFSSLGSLINSPYFSFSFSF